MNIAQISGERFWRRFCLRAGCERISGLHFQQGRGETLPRFTLSQQCQNAIPPSKGYKPPHLFIHPFALWSARRTDDDEEIASAKRFVNCPRKIGTSGGFHFVAI